MDILISLGLITDHLLRANQGSLAPHYKEGLVLLRVVWFDKEPLSLIILICVKHKRCSILLFVRAVHNPLFFICWDIFVKALSAFSWMFSLFYLYTHIYAIRYLHPLGTRCLGWIQKFLINQLKNVWRGNLNPTSK